MVRMVTYHRSRAPGKVRGGRRADGKSGLLQATVSLAPVLSQINLVRRRQKVMIVWYSVYQMLIGIKSISNVRRGGGSIAKVDGYASCKTVVCIHPTCFIPMSDFLARVATRHNNPAPKEGKGMTE